MKTSLIISLVLCGILAFTAIFFLVKKNLFKRIKEYIKRKPLIKATCVVLSVIILAQILYPAFDEISSVMKHANMNSITFETNGGSDIKPVMLSNGETLSEIPTPIKDDEAFIGWYTDNTLTSPFYSDMSIDKDMTLYAAYVPRDSDLKEYQRPSAYIEDCNANISMPIVSEIELTENNLFEYISIEVILGEMPEFEISPNGNTYNILPKTSYTAGGQYTFKLLSDKLNFSGEDESVREIAIRIHKDEVENIKFKEDLIYVLWSDTNIIDDGIYSVPSSIYTINEGDSVLQTLLIFPLHKLGKWNI